LSEALGEHTPTTEDGIAVETASKNHHANRATCDRQIGQMAPIAAMDPPGLCATARTGVYHGHGAHHDEGASFVARRVVHDKATRHESGSLECGLHSIDPFRGPTVDTRSTPPKVSQSPFSTPKHNQLCLRDDAGQIRPHGLGFAIASEWMFAPELKSGSVISVLDDWSLPNVELWAVYPTGRQATAKARAFVRFVEQRLSCETLADKNGSGGPNDSGISQRERDQAQEVSEHIR